MLNTVDILAQYKTRKPHLFVPVRAIWSNAQNRFGFEIDT